MKQLKLLFVGLLLVAANGLFAQITFTEGTFEGFGQSQGGKEEPFH